MGGRARHRPKLDTGKRQQKWFSGYRTKAEAEDGLADLLGKRLRGEVIDPDRTPLEEYVTAWIDGRTEELAPLSITQYRSVRKNPTSRAPHSAGCHSGRSAGAHVRAHEVELQGKGLSPATRSVVRAVLSRSLADAVADDLISTNPCVGARRSGAASGAETVHGLHGRRAVQPPRDRRRRRTGGALATGGCLRCPPRRTAGRNLARLLRRPGNVDDHTAGHADPGRGNHRRLQVERELSDDPAGRGHGGRARGAP